MVKLSPEERKQAAADRRKFKKDNEVLLQRPYMFYPPLGKIDAKRRHGLAMQKILGVVNPIPMSGNKVADASFKRSLRRGIISAWKGNTSSVKKLERANNDILDAGS